MLGLMLGVAAEGLSSGLCSTLSDVMSCHDDRFSSCGATCLLIDQFSRFRDRSRRQRALAGQLYCPGEILFVAMLRVDRAPIIVYDILPCKPFGGVVGADVGVDQCNCLMKHALGTTLALAVLYRYAAVATPCNSAAFSVHRQLPVAGRLSVR